MKLSTEGWAKFESIGKPESTQIISGTNQQIVMQFVSWLKDVYMGSRIQLTIARTQEELEVKSKAQKSRELDDELMAFLNDELESDVVPNEAVNNNITNNTKGVG
jgi:hypothetical protein